MPYNLRKRPYNLRKQGKVDVDGITRNIPVTTARKRSSRKALAKDKPKQQQKQKQRRERKQPTTRNKDTNVDLDREELEPAELNSPSPPSVRSVFSDKGVQEKCREIREEGEKLRIILLNECAKYPPEERPPDFDERVAELGCVVVNGEIVPKTDAGNNTSQPEYALWIRQNQHNGQQQQPPSVPAADQNCQVPGGIPWPETSLFPEVRDAASRNPFIAKLVKSFDNMRDGKV